MWKYYAVLSAVFAAATAIFAKLGLKNVDSNRKHVAWLVASGIATGISWLFYFKALQTGDMSKVAPIDKLSVALVVIFGILFLHEKLSWQVVTGTICILAGTLLLLHGAH